MKSPASQSADMVPLAEALKLIQELKVHQAELELEIEALRLAEQPAQRAEKAMQQTEQKFSLFMDLLPAIVFIKDKDSKLIYANKNMDMALGASKWIGLPTAEIFGSETAARISEDDQVTLQVGYRKIEESFLTLDGKVHDYETQKFSIPLSGEDALLGGIAIDVTEQRRAEAEIRKSKSDAELANLAKSEFLSRMSHELRTPMNSILGFSQLLDMGELTPGQRKAVNHILSSGHHLLTLINEVLDLSRIEAGRISLLPEPVQLSAVIYEILASVSMQAQSRMLTLTLVPSPANELFVMTDRQRLTQVLINLINNAVKYNSTGGSVMIRTERISMGEARNTNLRISITDTGQGISAEEIPKLFLPFERLGAEQTETEGTGLGLAVVKLLMDAMGGKIGLESMPGKGSTFWIELQETEKPVIGSPLKNPEPKKETPIKNRIGSILYIEDNLIHIRLIEQILHYHRSTISLILVSNEEETIQKAAESLPDMILLDLNLPNLSGETVLANLQADIRTRSIPVVIISTDAMPYQIDKLMKAGASHYLTKPVNVVEFLNVVDQIFERPF
jgi:PAS domain S-box-containing protein